MLCKPWINSVCLCVYVYTCICRYVWKPEVDPGCPPQLFSVLFFETWFLTESRAHHFSQTIQSMNPRSPPQFEDRLLCLAFYTGSGNPKSGLSDLCAFTAGYITDWPISPVPQFSFIRNISGTGGGGTLL